MPKTATASESTFTRDLDLPRAKGIIAAIDKVQAVIEFELDGTILRANDNFLGAVGYSLDEIRGQHHRIFCDPDYAASSAYQKFWENLREGKFDSGEYKRFGKSGNEIWIQASYNPVLDESGNPVRVVKFATDITAEKLAAAENSGKMAALDKVQARVEFTPDGTLLGGNDLFLKAMGYALHEVQGKHHRMFCADDYASSEGYRAFWAKLGRGEFDAGLYPRVAAGGRKIWLRASYNPILDDSGRVIKVVKFATDVTASVEMKAEIERTSNSLACSSTTLGETSATMDRSANHTAAQASVVSTAAENVADNIHTVAAGAEEMTASIREISQNANEVSQVAKSAVELARSTNDTVARLGESSHEIGNVIKVITAVAEQTNLLALNATIEAARAGEAGKGFAVVASEVKSLANETAKATEEIGDRILAIQTSTSEAVDAIGKITEVIGRISDLQTGIAGAVEEQTATTQEINRNVTEASNGSNEIAKTITGVASAAEETLAGTTEVREAAMQLSTFAKTLQDLVAKFDI